MELYDGMGQSFEEMGQLTAGFSAPMCYLIIALLFLETVVGGHPGMIAFCHRTHECHINLWNLL